MIIYSQIDDTRKNCHVAKQICVLIIAIITAIPLCAQSLIIDGTNGVYKIPCLVNGAKMNILFDSKASNATISSPIAKYLIENDYVSNSDLIGRLGENSSDADGLDHIILNLHDVEISGNHLTNVPVVVLDSQTVPLILCLSTLQKLGNVRINGNTLTITGTSQYNVGMRKEELLSKVASYVKNEQYAEALQCLKELSTITDLDNKMLFYYATCSWLTGDSRNALLMLKRIDNYDNIFDKTDYNYYGTIGAIYDDNERYTEAITYYQKAISFAKQTGNKEEAAGYTEGVASAYFQLGQYSTAYKYYSSASTMMYDFQCGNRADDSYHYRDMTGQLNMGETSYRSDDTDRLDFFTVTCAYYADQITEREFEKKLLLLYRANNAYAKQFMNSMNISEKDLRSYLAQ